MSKTITVNISIKLNKTKNFFSREVMIKQFFDFYDYYVEVCTENSNKDGQQMMVKGLRSILKNNILF
jgi:hypothetical protein